LGYEGENYPNMDLIFMNIGNIHVMRDSYNKLMGVCMNKVREISSLIYD
jgi:hypothetical protein